MPLRLAERAGLIEPSATLTMAAEAKKLKAQGKDVVELEIGDSPFESTASAKQMGIEAIKSGQTSCRAIVQAYIERAKAYNGTCTALVTADGKPIPPHWFAIDPENGAYVGPSPGEYPTAEQLSEFGIRQAMLCSVPFVPGSRPGERYR